MRLQSLIEALESMCFSNLYYSLYCRQIDVQSDQMIYIS